MKHFAQIFVTFIVIISLFIPSGLEFAGKEFSSVQDVEAAETTFAVVTDYGTQAAAETTVANMINGWTPDFVVTGGDNYQGSSNADVYPAAVGNYYGPGAVANGRTDFLTGQDFYPVPGNHDYYSGGGNLNRWYSYFNSFGHISFEEPYNGTTNAMYYEFVRGPVHFFMLDTGSTDDVTPDATSQQTWLDAALEASTSPWNIVMFHMPAASGGASHGSDTSIQWDFAGMGADFVISGHNHVYERINWNEITYFTAGAGGGNARQDWSATHLPPGAVAQDYYGVAGDTLSGAMRVNATDTTITFQYITTDGTVQDEVTYPDPASTCTTEIFSTTADTQIHSGGEATYNYGGSTSLLVDGDDGGDDVSALLHWDLSSIPANSTVDSASISLYIENVTASPGYDLYAMTQSWVEGSGNGTATANGATWNTYDGTNSWPGGAGADSDRGITVLANFTPTTVNTTYSASLNSDGLTVLQNWVNGTNSNFGFMINEGSTTNGMDFTSKEGTTDANRPKLTITYCQAVDIGDFVWEDDGDGVQENGEPGIAGVTVNLRDSSTDAIVQTTTTSTSGSYGFSGVAIGNYVIEFVKPSGYAFTLQDQGSDDSLDSDASSITGRTGTISWTVGGTPIDNIDVGLTPLVIGDHVWLDSDKDGIQDTGELGLAGIIVRLFNASGSLAGSTYTDASGDYDFEDVAAGDYYIEFDLPGGYTYSPKDIGSDVTLDSDVDMSTGRTEYFSIGSTASRLDLDCGMWQSLVPGQCSEITFQQDVSPSGYSGTFDTYIENGDTTSNGSATTVYWDYSPLKYALVRFDSIFGPGLIPPDKIIKSATLKYVVPSDTGDDAGVYEVDVPWTEDVLYSDFGGDPGVQQDEYSEPVAMASGDSGTQSIDVTSSLRRWYNDQTLNPNHGWIFIQDTDGGVQFASSENATTANRPTLTVTYCDPLTYDIGDEVWKDSNEDGLQDAIGTTEFPGGGVTVKLWQVGGGVVQTTKSTFDNSYGFSDISAGDYYIEFVLPVGYDYTTKNASGASTPIGAGDDSDADATSGFTDQFTFDGSTQISNIDAGFKGGYACYAIADGLAYDSDDYDSLIKIDLLTSKGTLVGTPATADGIETGAKEPGTDRIYTFDTATWGYMDTTTAAWTTVGSNLIGATCTDQNGTTRTIGDDGFDAVAYNPIDNTWWAAMRLTGSALDVLVKVNKDTGELDLNPDYFPGEATCVSMAAPAGNSNLTDIDDMAFDNTGTLYSLMNNGESEGRVVAPVVNGSGEYTGAGTDLGTIWRADLDEEVTDIEGFSIDENGRIWITTGGYNVDANIDHDTLFEVLDLSGAETLIAVPHIQMSIANSLIGGAANINYTDFEAVTCYGTGGQSGDIRSSLGNYVWFDVNGNGLQDTGETGVSGAVVELWGRGGDGLFGTADDVLLANKTTDSTGNYMFTNLPAGPYQVRLAVSNFTVGGALEGLSQTLSPVQQELDGGNQLLPYTITLPWSTDNLTADFGFGQVDWGDLPETYNTSAVNNGPSHFGGSLFLGALWDHESNGQPNATASGDDSDEDGAVKFGDADAWLFGTGGFTVTVTDNVGTRSGCLNIWMDHDNDQVLDQVVTNELVEEGSNTVTVPLPEGWLPEEPTTTSFYFRFRLVPSLGSGTTEDPYTCTEVSVASTGYVYGGEVEDYIFDIGTPTAASVTFSAVDSTDGILLSWEVFTEENIGGYILHRSLVDDFAGSIQLGDEIPTHEFPGNTIGGSYQYLDMEVERGVEYYYWLEAIGLDGINVLSESQKGVFTWKSFLPITLAR